MILQVIPLHLPPGDTSTERTVQIDGSSEQIETAKQLVNEVISEVFTFVQRNQNVGHFFKKACEYDAHHLQQKLAFFYPLL